MLLWTLLLACSPDFRQGEGRAPEPAVAGERSYGEAPFARLTTTQYQTLLTSLLGEHSEPTLPEDTYPYLYASIGAAEPLSESSVQLYEEAAGAVTAEVFADVARREALVGCAPANGADPCVADYIGRFGRLAWRRPLTDAEVARWQGAVDLLGGGDVWLGLQSATAGLLQSPWAIYRVELGEPLPGQPGLSTLTDWEVATRLSLLLWQQTPDAELLDAVAAGQLSTPEGLRARAEAMLDDPRARVATQVFFEQYLDLPRLDRAAPDPTLYPQFTEGLRSAMRTEVLLLVDDLVWRQDRDLRALFTERRAYVNSELAAHYGLVVPEATSVAFVPVELPVDGERAGILGLGAFLTMNAHAVDNSPTLRGKYILERVLCATVPPPPGDVDVTLDTGDTGAETLRERLEQHREDPECAGCHALTDPPGLLFEHFNAIGAWRDDENGLPIDTSGELLGTPLAGSGELGEVLAEHPSVGPCVVKQLYRHAQGRIDSEADTLTLEELEQGFADSGYRFQPLLLDLISHPSFRVVGPASPSADTADTSLPDSAAP